MSHPDDLRAPRPLASPVPPSLGDDPSPSGSHNVATIREAVVIADQAAAASKTEITRIISSADVKWFAATMVAVAIGAVLLVGWFDARGAERQLPLEKRVEKLEAGAQQQALESVRATTMLENLSRERGLPVPPPAPKVLLPDGGTP